MHRQFGDASFRWPASTFHHRDDCSMLGKEEGYRSDILRTLWGEIGRWTLLTCALVTSLGAIAPWWWQSSAGIARRNTLHSFAEDYQAASYYPIFRACRLVHTLTEHRIDRRIEIWENWVQWMLGQMHAPLLRTQKAELILEHGQGDCSERVAVLQSLLRWSRLNTRIVGLGGHVVLEVQANGTWYTADPDYGVVHQGTVDEIAASSYRSIATPLMRAGLQQEIIDRYVPLFQSIEDNVAMPLNSPISPRLHWVEELSFFIVIALPCTSWILYGLLWLNSPRRTN